MSSYNELNRVYRNGIFYNFLSLLYYLNSEPNQFNKCAMLKLQIELNKQR